MNLTNRGETDPIGDACASALVRQERLIVVAAVDGGLVQQAADAAKTDRSERTIRGGRGRQDCEVGPAAAVVGKIVERSLIEADGEVLPRGVDAGHVGWRKSERSGGIQRDVHRRGPPDLYHDVRDCKGMKPGAVTSTV